MHTEQQYSFRLGMVRVSLAMLLWLVITTVHARGATISGQLVAPSTLGRGDFSNAVVSLDHGREHEELVRVDGSFDLLAVPPGVYTMTVFSPKFAFPLYKVEVKENGTVRAVEEKGGKKTVLRYPLSLLALGAPVYFEKRQEMSLYSMFANRMGFMMLFMVVIVLVLPRMMDSIDPEEMKRMQEEMRGQEQDPSKVLSGLLGGQQGNDDDDSDSD